MECPTIVLSLLGNTLPRLRPKDANPSLQMKKSAQRRFTKRSSYDAGLTNFMGMNKQEAPFYIFV